MGPVLSLLLLFSLIIRSLFISSSPPELFGDEIDVGYQAYSLFKTGKDLYAQPFPTYIHSLSEWRAPLLMYFTVPSIALFGSTEIGVRAPEIALGVLGIAIIFLLVYHTTKSSPAAIFSALALALAPWHFQYSRAAFEVMLLLDLLMLGSLLMIKKHYSLSLIFLALTFYTYSTATVFTPLLFLVLLVLFRPKLKLRSLILPILILLPFAYHIFLGNAAERFGTVSILNHPKIVEEAVQIRSNSPSPLEKMFTNRPILTAKKFVTNYLSAFSTEFLFVRGDPTIRHNTNFTGELLPIMVLPLIIGLYFLLKSKNRFWIMWLVISPIPASLTYDGGNHATRLFVLLPPLAAAIGLGLSRLKFFRLPVLLLLFFSAAQFFNYYFYRYPTDSWRWWHVGYKQAFQQLSALDSNYARIFVNNTYEPSLIRFLFYTNYSPAKFHKNFTLDQPVPEVFPNYYGFFLAPKYYFGGFSIPPNKSLPDLLSEDSLYLISQRDDAYGNWQKNPPGGVRVLHTSVDPYSDPILYLVTRSQ